MAARVLIAGCGDVGNALAERLLKDGSEVWGSRRRIEQLAPGVKPWQVDLTAPDTWSDLPASFDHVLYMPSPDRRDESDYRAVFVDGLRALIDRLDRGAAPVRRFLFVSSTAVYAQNQGEWVDEHSATEPSRFNGRVLREAEEVVLAAPWTGVNVRFSGIYGEGRLRLVRQVADRAPYDADRWTNRIHVDDCARALQHLIDVEHPAETYVGSDDHPAQMSEVVAWMSEALGTEPPPVRGDSDPTLNKRCRNARLRETGFDFAYPTFRDGYAPIVERFLQTSG